MAFDVDAKLGAMGMALPEPPKPIASYVPAARVETGSGALIFVSGQLPLVEGELAAAGSVPSEVSVEQAQDAARRCLLNALAVVKAELRGDWSALRRIVRLGVFVRSEDDFTGQSGVANGASDMLVELFGEAGRHARAAVGVNALPLGATVEVELVVESG